MNITVKLLLTALCGVICLPTLNAKKAVIVSDQKKAKSDLQQDTVVFEKVKNMYAEFVKLVADSVNDVELTSFFNTYFDVEKITEKFTGSKTLDAKLTSALINYFKFLLNGQVIKQVKDYSLDANFSQMSRKNSVSMLCKLKNDQNGIIDMSVTLSRKSSKILELAFMKSIYLIKGAKNIIDLYCQEKVLNYKGMNVTERIKVCNDALVDYVNKQSGDKAN